MMVGKATQLATTHKINEFPFNGTQDIKTFSTCSFKKTNSTNDLQYAIANDLTIETPADGMHIYLYFTNNNNVGEPRLCVNKNKTISDLTTTGVSYPMVDSFTSGGLPSFIGTNPNTNGIVVGAIYGFTFKTIDDISYWVRDYSPQNFEVDNALDVNSLNPISNQIVSQNISDIKSSIGSLQKGVNSNTASITEINKKFPANGVGSKTKGIYLQENGTFAVTDQMLPLSAGSDYPLTNYLAFSTTAKNKAYGDTLPTSAQNGQLFFKKGSEKPVILRKDYSVTSEIAENTSVPLSNYTGSVITSSTNLEIFHNGILLNNDGSHYAVDDKNNISFKYNIKSGDTLSFVQTTPVNTIDLSKYTTMAQNDAKYLPKNNGTAQNLTILQTINDSDTNINYPCIKFDVLNPSTNEQTTAIKCKTDSDGFSFYRGSDNGILLSQDRYNTMIYEQLLCYSDVRVPNNTIFAKTVKGAVWNDYAEYRICKDNFIPGMVVCENGDDTLSISKERMQPAAAVISDTFGFAIGETDDAKCPIAVSGRVLAIPYESREEFKKAIGRPVCAGPNGTVSIMTDEEYRDKGYCAIGTISAVPDYATWGTGNVAVNDRIWIKVG